MFVHSLQLEVSLSSVLPPLLPGESYECVLTAEEGGVEIAVDAVSSTSTTYSCNITGALPPQLELGEFKAGLPTPSLSLCSDQLQLEEYTCAGVVCYSSGCCDSLPVSPCYKVSPCANHSQF